MARRGTRGLAAAAALVLTLGLVACGGDDDGGDDAADETTTEATDETTTEAGEPGDDTSEPAEPGDTEPADDETTTEPETTTTVASGLTEDEARAIPAAVDLTLEDVQSFNPTFAEQELDDEDEQLLDGCLGDAADLEPLAGTDGVQYEASAAYAASTTTVMASEEDAVALVDAFAAEAFVDCLEDGVLATIGEDGVTADLSGYPGGTRFGDQWANVGGVISADGFSAAIEFHALRTGSIVTIFLYSDQESGEGTAYVVDGLLTLIDERQVAAVG